MPRFATEEQVRRDKKFFTIRNGRNKRVRFAKPFTSVPQVFAEGNDAGGAIEVPTITNISLTGFRLKFSHKAQWTGTWEAIPPGDLS